MRTFFPGIRLDEIEKQLNKHAHKTNKVVFPNDQYVEVKHEDGSYMLFKHALLIKENEWIYIFTEHCGRHWFHAEDVSVRSFTIKPAHKLKIDIT